MAKSFLALLLAAAIMPRSAIADPRDAERFTRIAGFSLADLPSFDDYAKKLGASPIRSTGDAGDFDTRVCYRAAQSNAVVELFHGEVDWGFSVHVPRKRDNKCPGAKALTRDQLNIAGVVLGLPESEYQELTGKPSSVRGNRIGHYFEYTHVLTDAELDEMLARHRRDGYPAENPEELRHWDVGITLDATFVNGRLASFTVDRVETN